MGEKLVGLDVGDERLIRLPPSEAFGEWDPDAVVTMRESQIMGDLRLEDGMMLEIGTSTGFTAVCRVYRITEDRVAPDFNHPLAGEPVTLFVRVRKVVPPAGRTAAAVGYRAHSKRVAEVSNVVLVLAVPDLAFAAAADVQGRFGPILFGLAVLVVAAKVGGLLVQRLGHPPVLGKLLVGIALGNLLSLTFGRGGIAFVRNEPTLLVLAQMGVLILLFDVGLEADLRALLKVGWSSLAVAIGMIPRGEVGLIFAGIGASLTLRGEPILSQGAFSAVVLMVLATTLVAPIGLRWAFRRSPSCSR